MQGYKDLVIQAKNDSKYMQSLLCIMEPLVKSYAKKIFFLDWDDATQELNLAIIEAVKTIATCEDDYQCLKFITNSVKYKFAHLCKRNLKKRKNTNVHIWIMKVIYKKAIERIIHLWN